ncbi:MAG: hypothetical protein WCQ57_12925 [Verrucomicrobiota bacterium]
MKIIPASFRQAAIRFCREVFAERAVARRQELAPSAAPVSLHMVVGHEMLRMGLLTLRSFEFHTRKRWSPVIHDDGTMTDNDLAELHRHFPDATIIRRARADGELAAALAQHPVCRENRMKHHWFLKVFDTRHYATHDHYIVMDSDIVFFRRPDFLLQWIERRPEDFWFMKDTREKYALAREDIEKAMGFPLWQKVNSGLDLMFRPGVDLALAEKFLTHCVPHVREFAFLEQTMFAVTGSAWGRGGFLPPEYEISWTNFRRKGAVCRHYVGPFKNDALYIEGASTFWRQSRMAK